MRQWCSLHASNVRKKRQNTLLHAVYTSNKHVWENWHCMPQSPHTLLRPFVLTAYQQLHSIRPLQLPGKTATRCVSHLMTRHRTTSAVWDFWITCWPAISTPHSTEPRQKKKKLIATWHWCQLDRNCDHQISTSIRVKCWWHRVFFRQRAVVDADYSGWWTQIFGGKASDRAGDFWTYPPASRAPVGGDSIGIS